MNNDRKKILTEVLSDLRRFADGEIPETDAIIALLIPFRNVWDCTLSERQEVIKDMAEINVLNSVHIKLSMVMHHLQDGGADYKELIDVYIKAAIRLLENLIK